MINTKEKKYRMYGIVPYNLSPIQQGIQFGHAVVEYGLHRSSEENYLRWARVDKTFIILNGGTTNTNPLNLGTLNQHASMLELMEIPHSLFYEPDLGDQLTAVVFLVENRVWDKETWPDAHGSVQGMLPYYRSMLASPDILTMTDYDISEYERLCYEEKVWLDRFGASEDELKSILFLRDFLKKFRLA